MAISLPGINSVNWFTLSAPDTLDKYLDKSKHLGPVDMSTVIVDPKAIDPEEEARQQRVKQMPPLDQCYNLTDFEVEPFNPSDLV